MTMKGLLRTSINDCKDEMRKILEESINCRCMAIPIDPFEFAREVKAEIIDTYQQKLIENKEVIK